ncbi:MAG: glyoxylate/hydroxypyruvate reductase A [Alphaproteobacteria bacterium]|nr:glyoxylate/hydroxypyruvate reductase A [Alphaproteobacteria bacterium]
MALVYISPWSDANLWRQQVARHLPGEELRVWPDVGDARAIDVALVWKPPHGALATLPNLKLIANLGAGVEHLMADPALPRHVPMTRLVHPLMTEQMSEYCALGVMMGLRRVAEYMASQRAGQWVAREADVAPPSQRAVGVLGLGELGGDTARKLAALGYQVHGWSRSPRDLPGIACHHGRDGLDAMLGACDAVVCLLPLTTATRGIIDRRFLGRLKPGAILVNAARGAHVVDDDLLAALDDGRVGFALLDVFYDEPLPAGHRYWSHPRVMITPHIAALTLPVMADVILANVKRLRAGQPLVDQVDPTRGY